MNKIVMAPPRMGGRRAFRIVRGAIEAVFLAQQIHPKATLASIGSDIIRFVRMDDLMVAIGPYVDVDAPYMVVGFLALAWITRDFGKIVQDAVG